jgi:hypothetical protein
MILAKSWNRARKADFSSRNPLGHFTTGSKPKLILPAAIEGWIRIWHNETTRPGIIVDRLPIERIGVSNHQG